MDVNTTKINSHIVTKQNKDQEGRQIDLEGACSNDTVIFDNFSGNSRFYSQGGKYTIGFNLKNKTISVAATGAPWSGITGKTSTFVSSSHTQDDRYYTEPEINTKMGCIDASINVWREVYGTRIA